MRPLVSKSRSLVVEKKVPSEKPAAGAPRVGCLRVVLAAGYFHEPTINKVCACFPRRHGNRLNSAPQSFSALSDALSARVA
jgi:hypothetical protein